MEGREEMEGEVKRDEMRALGSVTCTADSKCIVPEVVNYIFSFPKVDFI